MKKKKLKGQNKIVVKSDIDIDVALGNAHREQYLEENPHGFKKVKHVHKNKKKYNRKKNRSSRDYIFKNNNIMRNLTKILVSIRIIHRIDVTGQYTFGDTSNDLSLSGYKRMVYGIWHNGKNEDGHSILEWMTSDARELYIILIDEYKLTPEIKMYF